MCRVKDGICPGIGTETLCREAQREAEWTAGLRLCRVLSASSSFFRGLAAPWQFLVFSTYPRGLASAAKPAANLPSTPLAFLRRGISSSDRQREKFAFAASVP